MPFTATIKNISGNGNGQLIIDVMYADSATGFSQEKVFTYPADGTVTQAQAVADITASGNILKTNLAVLNTLQSKVGNVITI